MIIINLSTQLKPSGWLKTSRMVALSRLNVKGM